jgi:hypothetical protein
VFEAPLRALQLMGLMMRCCFDGSLNWMNYSTPRAALLARSSPQARPSAAQMLSVFLSLLHDQKAFVLKIFVMKTLVMMN